MGFVSAADCFLSPHIVSKRALPGWSGWSWEHVGGALATWRQQPWRTRVPYPGCAA